MTESTKAQWSPRSRSLRRTVVVTMAAVGVLVGSACTPPTFAAPVLPPTVGVTWLRDTGGTVGATYQPAYERYTTLGGVVTGPGSAGVWGSTFLPNGTASFPWNGFAGDGITTTTSPSGPFTNYTVSFPGGRCTYTSSPGSAVMGIAPSPDGTKVAIEFNDFDAAPMTAPTTVSVSRLGAGCQAISHASYDGVIGGPRGGSGDRLLGPLFIWSPDSDAILYSLGGPASDTGRVVRLDASAGATPVTVIDDGPSVAITPTGWGIDGRVLITRSTAVPGSPDARYSTIEIVDGAVRRVIDSAVVTGQEASPHIGFFVPGTATVVYHDMSVLVTNSQGTTYPWARVRLYDDVTWGKISILGVDPPLTWHTEGAQQVPNGERIDRFVR